MAKFAENVAKQNENKAKNELELKIVELQAKLDDKKLLTMNVDDIEIISNLTDPDFELQEIELLAGNIEEIGQQQPVLISKDKKLIFGHRRSYAIKFLRDNNRGNGQVKYIALDKNFQDIDKLTLNKIRVSENIHRRAVDNFTLSKVILECIAGGMSQREAAKEFNKSTALVSMLVSFGELPEFIVKLMKEFQVFAWSRKKFTRVNFLEDPKENDFYNNQKGIFGVKKIYAIAKIQDPKEQKEYFYKTYKNRLSEEEITELFPEMIQAEEKESKQDDEIVRDKMKSTIRDLEKVSGSIKYEHLEKIIDPEKRKNLEKALKMIAEARQLFVDNSL